MAQFSTFALSLSAICLLTTPTLANSITNTTNNDTGTIIQLNGNTYTITGGETGGTNNLFHSFEQFGLSAGEIADFLSGSGIANIFGRVMGGNASVINGSIQATPNLYLMNPAGIVFGAGASLDIGGDFTATTADGIGLGGEWFNATGANDYATLVGAPNQFRFTSGTPGAIANFGNLITDGNIMLLGGTVLNEGTIISNNGGLTIAAIPGSRNVRLEQPGMLLSLEVSGQTATGGITPLDLPELLTGAGISANTADIDPGDVHVAGEVQGSQVDLYAAGQATATDTELLQGQIRSTRFTAGGDNPTAAVFVDGRADDATTLVLGAVAGTVAQIVEQDADGVAFVADQLEEIKDAVGELDSVAIVAEGNVGNFWLGKDWVRSASLSGYHLDLERWGDALAANADLSLYSSSIASSTTGVDFINELASFTNRRVWASSNVTSSSDYGGDWELERSSGGSSANGNSPVNPFTNETRDNWNGKLSIHTVESLADDGTSGTLRDAIATAQTNDYITFSILGTLTLNGTEIEWNNTQDNLTLDGNGIIIDGNSLSRIFKILADTAAIKNITIQNGSSTEGGGIYSSGSLVINNSRIINNQASQSGGGITSGGSVYLQNTQVSGNSALLSGGGIASHADVSLLDSEVVDNSVLVGGGGGIFTIGDITATNTLFYNNKIDGISDSGAFSLIGSISLISNKTLDINSDFGFGSTNQSFNISGKDVNILVPIDLTEVNISIIALDDINIKSLIQSNGGDIFFHAGRDINSSATVSTSRRSINSSAFLPFKPDLSLSVPYPVNILDVNAGNITIISGGNTQIRNLIASSIIGNGGNVSITSTGGSIHTTSGSSRGLILTDSLNGNGGEVLVSAAESLTIGKVSTEGLNGFGGNVTLSSQKFTRLTSASRGHFSTALNSISATGTKGSGEITVVHGGSGSIPFTVGNSTINGSAGGFSTGTASPIQAINTTQSFQHNYTQGIINILTNSSIHIHNNNWQTPSSPAPLTPDTVRLGSHPSELMPHGQNPQLFFIENIGEQLAAETTIDPETGEFTWRFPNEKDPIVGQIEVPIFDIGMIDERLELEYEDYFGEELDSEDAEPVTYESIREALRDIQEKTKTVPVIVYAIPGVEHYDLDKLSPEARKTIKETDYENHVALRLITPEDNVIPKIVEDVGYDQLTETVQTLTDTIAIGRNHPTSKDYLPAAQQLYKWLIAPIESELNGLKVDTLLFVMSAGLRTVPLAALHDGDNFLTEKYSLGIIPSVGLTNSTYKPIHDSPVLAMGASEFRGLDPLPAVPAELDAIAHHRESELFLNEDFTPEALKHHSQSHRAQIIHLATHANFASIEDCDPSDQRCIENHSKRTYISTGDDKIRLDQMRNFGWHNDPQIELLVLSACETAIGDLQAELGFAGLAVQTGVKSALASLWQVNDLGTVALMSAFYKQLNNPDISIKAEALRQAQIGLLRSEVVLQDGLLNGLPLPADLANDRTLDFSHPFYWSGFTLVGSPW